MVTTSESEHFDIVVTTQQLSDLTGLSTRVLQMRAKDGSIPKLAHGKFSLAATLPELLRHAAGGSAGGDVAGMTPRQRSDHYQAELRRVELMERCRQLIPAEEVSVEMRALFTTFVGFLATLPDTLERDAGISGEVAERVQQAIDEARDRLHDVISYTKK